ncbi:glutathione S-transferase L2, chloroplastic-like [Hibiscus syriacus]|uniref:glutathione S-transferase L2, chloroplastic-like n=1 Tax=Hibiscus syriacus TaxID=106335 RepID=UPI00192086D9|nr:glutathione S-transferase L2, chloroplastic-like [Hibiscus syriacus]
MAYTCPFAQRVWITRNYKVPALEHNGKVIGDSLHLIKYVNSNFEGPSLLPNVRSVELFSALSEDLDGPASGAASDHLEHALTKYDGPFHLGDEFSLVSFEFFCKRSMNDYDITAGRPKLAA